jgi:hypothetical protein
MRLRRAQQAVVAAAVLATAVAGLSACGSPTPQAAAPLAPAAVSSQVSDALPVGAAAVEAEVLDVELTDASLVGYAAVAATPAAASKQPVPKATASKKPAKKPVKKPALATPKAAKKIVVTALGAYSTFGPYRAVVGISVRGKGREATGMALMTADVVPPDRARVTLGPPDAGITSIQIGDKAWVKLGPDEEWVESDEPVDAIETATEAVDARDVVSVTEKPSKDPSLRVFSVVTKGQKKGERVTVVVDRSGRLRSLGLTAPDGSVGIKITYNPKIVINPPV